MDRAAAEEDSPAGIPVGVGIREAEEDIPAVAGNPEAVADNRVVEGIRAAGEDNTRFAEAGIREAAGGSPAVADSPVAEDIRVAGDIPEGIPAAVDNRVAEDIRAAGEDNSRSAEAYRRKSYRTWRKR